MAEAWPDSDFMKTVPDDQGFNVVSLGSVLADSAGHYVMDLDISGLSSNYVDNDGHVEIMLTAEYNGMVNSTFSPDASTVEASSITFDNLDVAGGINSPNGPAAATCQPHPISGSENGPYQTKLMDVMAQGKVTGTGTYSNGGCTSTTLGVEALGVISGNWGASGTATISTSSSS